MRTSTRRKCGYTVRVFEDPSSHLSNFLGRRNYNGGVRAEIRTRRNTLKKTGLLTLLVMATLLFALAFTAAAAGPKAAAAPVPALAAVPATPAAAAAVPEAHPHIHEALEAMRSAKHHLDTAEHDFHGHRVKAIEHLDQAIHEAEICEQEK